MSEENKAPEAKARRTLIGRVDCNKMDKTVSVVVESLVKHPAYGKYIRRTSKLLAHDADNACKEGDRVAISECRPISKNKAWQVVDIVERAPEQD